MIGVGSLLRYEDFEQVGEGSFGHVYRARDKQPHPNLHDSGANAGAGQLVALKRLIIPAAKELTGFPIFALREIAFLKRLTHPNIVSLLDIVSSKGCEDIESEIKTESLKPSQAQGGAGGGWASQSTGGRMDVQQRCGSTFLVFEYVEHDLSGLIDARYPFDKHQCQFLALQLMRALAHLQGQRIMHRDVKSANVLVTNSLVLKLADFGMARQLQDEAHAALLRGCRQGQGRGLPLSPAAALLGRAPPPREEFTNNVVTMWYRPPELLLGDTRYLWQAVDVWSAGCVLAELELLRPLFPGKTVPGQLNMIMDVLGSPSEATWAGVSQLANYASLVQERAERTNASSSSASFRVTFRGLISEDLLGFIDCLLVLVPDKRMTPAAALTSSKYLMSCSEVDVRPLGVGSSSLHEFETKRSMRLKRVAAKQQCALLERKAQDYQSGSGGNCENSREVHSSNVSDRQQGYVNDNDRQDHGSSSNVNSNIKSNISSSSSSSSNNNSNNNSNSSSGRRDQSSSAYGRNTSSNNGSGRQYHSGNEKDRQHHSSISCGSNGDRQDHKSNSWRMSGDGGRQDYNSGSRGDGVSYRSSLKRSSDAM